MGRKHNDDTGEARERLNHETDDAERVAIERNSTLTASGVLDKAVRAIKDVAQYQRSTLVKYNECTSDEIFEAAADLKKIGEAKRVLEKPEGDTK